MEIITLCPYCMDINCIGVRQYLERYLSYTPGEGIDFDADPEVSEESTYCFSCERDLAGEPADYEVSFNIVGEKVEIYDSGFHLPFDDETLKEIIRKIY